MAITKIGPPLAGIRGTIGGITYSENKSSTYAKLWSMPSNPRTAKQTIERGFLALMPELWRALTDAQRAAWRTFAADPAQELTNSLGEDYYASGYNWFCKCNIRLLRVGRATIVPVPVQARPAAPTIDDFRVCEAGSESDECNGGVASSDSEEPGLGADKAFDNSTADADRWQTLVFVTAAWLRYDFPGAINIKRYRIMPLGADLTTAPKDWTFEVWSGAQWRILQTVTNENYAAKEWYDYYCPNPYTETDYRINVTANQGHASRLSIVEMEMYKANNVSVVIYPEDNFDDAPNYDLVLHVSMGASIGMGVQYPGFAEILAQQAPGRWYGTFQTEIEGSIGTVMPERSWFAELFRQTREGLRSAAQTERTVTQET